MTKPQFFKDGIQYKHTYTTMSEPKGVVYLNKDKQRKLIRFDELKNHCEWTKKDVKRTKTMIKKIGETLKEIRHMEGLKALLEAEETKMTLDF
nr:hypothetical protein [Tanacetum cinerariifolium]